MENPYVGDGRGAPGSTAPWFLLIVVAHGGPAEPRPRSLARPISSVATAAPSALSWLQVSRPGRGPLHAWGDPTFHLPGLGSSLPFHK